MRIQSLSSSSSAPRRSVWHSEGLSLRAVVVLPQALRGRRQGRGYRVHRQAAGHADRRLRPCAELPLHRRSLSDDDSVPSYDALVGVWKLGHDLGIEGLCDRALEAMGECRRVTQHIPATPPPRPGLEGHARGLDHPRAAPDMGGRVYEVERLPHRGSLARCRKRCSANWWLL